MPKRASTPAPNPSAAKTETAAASSGVFYRYRTSDGRIAIADSLSNVPESARARAERVEISEPAPTRYPVMSELVTHMDWPSFAAGFGVALTLGVVVMWAGRGSHKIIGFLVLLALVVGASGAYFGWLRRTSGENDALFASPRALIDDAQHAVDKLKQHQKDQDKVIEDAQHEAR